MPRRATLLRWTAALITSLVCLMLGQTGAHYAYSQTPDCGLKEVAAWRTQLERPTEEATPDYKLRVNEDFLKACPDRPERRDAHLMAGIAAVDGGYAEAARDHFLKARSPSRPLDTKPWFGLVTALAETGDDDAAWKERDDAIAHWLSALDRDGLADVTSVKQRGGVVHKVRFIAVDSNDRIRGVWLGVPTGPGYPSAVVLGSEGFRASLYKLRAAKDAQRLETIDLVGCRERITLTQAEGYIDLDLAEAAAEAALETYLEAPDMAEPADYGKMLNTCIWPDRMMPRPDPLTAELID